MSQITRYTDEWGEWEIPAPGVRLLVKPSDAWLEANKEEKPPEPSTAKPTVWDEIAAAYTEGVNSIDE